MTEEEQIEDEEEEEDEDEEIVVISLPEIDRMHWFRVATLIAGLVMGFRFGWEVGVATACALFVLSPFDMTRPLDDEPAEPTEGGPV